MNDTAPASVSSRDLTRRELVLASSTSGFSVVPANMAQALEFADVMAKSNQAVRAPFRNNVGACLALALQAWRWGADPFAVANKAYIVNDQLAYEAQLIHAIVNSSALLAKRLRYEFTGDGNTRKCNVIGWLKGDDDPFEYESPTVDTIAVKNSPLWKGDPDQQLTYYGTRAWARRHLPEVLLGIYSSDELGEPIDVTPVTIQEHQRHAQTVEAEPWRVVDHVGEVYGFQSLDKAIEALRRIFMMAAADGRNTLQTAWDNNADFIADLYEEDRTKAEAMDRLCTELRQQPSSEGETSDEGRPAADDAKPSEGASSGQSAAGRQPLGLSVPPTQPGAAQEGTRRDATVASHDEMAKDQANSPAGPGLTVPTSASPSEGTQSPEQHDPFWDGATLRIMPPGKTGRSPLSKDWKVWPAMLGPRIRQARTLGGVNQLWMDNEDLMEQFARDQGEAARDELIGMFEDARMRLS